MGFDRCAAAAVGLLLVGAGCDDRVTLDPGERCELNTECEAPLVCRLERCRQECRATRDCRAGLSCVRDDDGLGACQLPDEQQCTLSSDCPEPLVCRQATCTNACETDRDCPPASRCEEDEDGDRGCIDQSEASCRLNSDCPRPLICAVDRRCREECRTDRDCRDGTVCDLDASPRVCVRPRTAPDGGPSDGGLGGPGDGGVRPPSPKAIVAGYRHTCAARSSSELRCWGENGEGQLGDDTTMDRAQPVAVALTGVTAMGAGTAHTCAQTSAGLQCWGRNAEGQLGLDRSDPFISTPTIVTGATARSLGLGREHSCIVDASGARCWGGNTRGQVGDGSTTPRPRPVAVEGLVAAPVQVAARGSHTCALLETGQVQCWGDNSFGQLGTGASSSAPAPTPRLVVAIDDAVEVAAGSTHTCARRRSGEVWCWGSNAFGQVGDGTVRNERPQPTRAGSLTDATQLTAGVDHSCALDAAGAVWCWGNNTDGQLGIDNTVPGGVIEMPTPTRVASLDPADRIGAGDAHTCVRLAGGGYRCWGFNESGQLGDGTMSATFTPVAVEWP